MTQLYIQELEKKQKAVRFGFILQDKFVIFNKKCLKLIYSIKEAFL